jgi:hypothetical protein
MTPFTLTKTVCIIGLLLNIICSVWAMAYVASKDEYKERAEVRAVIEQSLVRHYYQRIAIQQVADKAEKKRARDFCRGIQTPVSEFAVPYREFVIKQREGK